MTICTKVRTADEARVVLRETLESHFDLAWARFRWSTVPGADDSTATLHLLVMPKYLWWSTLEHTFFHAQLEDITGRMVFLEDERTLHPRRIKEVLQRWELILDRDERRRVKTEFASQTRWTRISNALRHAGSGRSKHLAKLLQSREQRYNSELRFHRIIAFSGLSNMLGSYCDPDKEQRAEISNAAQEAGCEALAQCCDVSELANTEPPRSVIHAFAFLAENDWLNKERAKRLSTWVQLAVPLHNGQSIELLAKNRISELLTIRADDLHALCDAVALAASDLSAPPSFADVPQDVLEFDCDQTLVRLNQLLAETQHASEREVVRELIGAVYLNKAIGPRNTAGATELDKHYKDEPIKGCLVFHNAPFESSFVRALAAALYGDPSLVYSMRETIEAWGHTHFDAVWGRPARFRTVGILSLPDFLKAHGRGLIYFEHPERFDPVHMDVLGSILKKGSLTDPQGNPVYVGNCCIIVSAAFPVGSVRELGEHNYNDHIVHSESDKTPEGFEREVYEHVTSQFPKHLSPKIMAEFRLCMWALWEQYQKNLTAGLLDDPLIRQDQMSKESPRSTEPHHEVQSLEKLLTCVRPDHGVYDFFISYSWRRSKDQARALAKQLQARGHHVFLDVDKIPLETPMEQLIPDLVRSVRSSKAIVIFEIQLDDPLIDVNDRERSKALQRAHAIRAPMVGGYVDVDWSWQTLELLASTRFLSVGVDNVKANAHGQLDHECILHSQFASVEELVVICEAYLQYIEERNGT